MHDGQWLRPYTNAFVIQDRRFDVILFDFQLIWTDGGAEYIAHASRKMEYRYDTGASDLRTCGQVHFVQILLLDARCEHADRFECCAQPSQCKLLVLLKIKFVTIILDGVESFAHVLDWSAVVAPVSPIRNLAMIVRRMLFAAPNKRNSSW